MVIINEATSHLAYETTEVIELEANAKYCLPYGRCSLHILNGVAWVTMQAEEHILKGGDELIIPRQPHAVIVSAAHFQRLRFEIRQ